MSTVDRKELMNEVYDAALYTGGAFSDRNDQQEII